MPAQASHLLRLPVELRLIIYGYIFNDPRQATLQHSLTYVSELISEEVLPILLIRFAFFFWTATPCNEEWYLAFQPRKKTWRMRLTNVSEWPVDIVPSLQTKTSYHLLVGRQVCTDRHLFDRLAKNYQLQLLTHGCLFQLQTHDQQDGVKPLIEAPVHGKHRFDTSTLWFERGRAGDPEVNKKLIQRVWHRQWLGGGRRGPSAARMCRIEHDLANEVEYVD